MARVNLRVMLQVTCDDLLTESGSSMSLESCRFAPLLSFCIRLLLNALQEVNNREALQHQTGLSERLLLPMRHAKQ